MNVLFIILIILLYGYFLFGIIQSILYICEWFIQRKVRKLRGN